MEIEEVIKGLLVNDEEFEAIAGNKVFADAIQTNVPLPAVTYSLVSDIPDHLLTGQDELEHPVFQITAFAASKEQAILLRNIIKGILNDYHGAHGDINIQKIEQISHNAYLIKSESGSYKTYTETLDYEIYFIRG